ncbi:MAG: universal stress protein, partial [Polyangiaceae bacterium]
GRGDRAVLERAVLGSAAEQITRHASCSVLVVRELDGDGPILAASDLSDAALPAVEAAGAEATRRAAELILVHALDVAQPFTALFEPTATLDEATVDKLVAAADELLQATLSRAGHAGRTAVVLGPPTRAIADAASEHGASLVVVATHGHSGLRRIVLGSVAEGVVRQAPCNVLVVRSRA